MPGSAVISPLYPVPEEHRQLLRVLGLPAPDPMSQTARLELFSTTMGRYRVRNTHDIPTRPSMGGWSLHGCMYVGSPRAPPLPPSFRLPALSPSVRVDDKTHDCSAAANQWYPPTPETRLVHLKPGRQGLLASPCLSRLARIVAECLPRETRPGFSCTKCARVPVLWCPVSLAESSA